MFTVSAVAQSGGQTLYNGIVLPQQWPPVLTPSQAYSLPTYITNPPAVIPIDLGRQLFVDDFLIQQTTLTRTQHQPVMYPLNPIITPGPSDFGFLMPFSGGMWFDPQDQLFKAWLFCGDSPYAGVCYEYSTDGKNWIRPNIPGAIVPNKAEVLTSGLVVWMDLEDPDPSRKYKAFNVIPNGNAILVFFSPDGIHWTQGSQSQYPISLVYDRTTLFWNPFRKVWVDSLKNYTTVPATPNRSAYLTRLRNYTESPDLMHWNPAEPQNFSSSFWTGPDDHDPPYYTGGTFPHLYNLDAVGYESVMVGLFSWLQPGGDEDNPNNLPGPDIVELGVGFSRDGFQWVRPTRGSGPGPNGAFIAASNIPGTWNMGNTQSAGGCFMIVGDELWFYFSGRTTTHNDPSDGVPATTGLATLRRDGFYSMNAGSNPGTLVTRSVQFSGKYLFVNVKDPQGSLQVQVLNATTNQVLATSLPLNVDKTLQQVSWNGLSDLSGFANQPIKFQFTLTNGELYSFWVSSSASGASNGYVAANGPGFTGPTDTVGITGYPSAVSTPEIYPVGGTVSSSSSITILTRTVGATTYYTLDGTTPTTLSSAYTGPIHLATSATLKAVAYAPGLNSSAVASASFTVVNTPPTLSITSPANGQIVSGGISIAANASSNLGIASVQFLVDGVSLATDTNSPYSASLSTTTLTNTSHQISVIATDTIGNQTTSSITITVDNLSGGPAAGLVGYWSFDTNFVNGATLLDQSGNNLNATADSTTFVSGKIGQALAYNGTSSLVRNTNNLTSQQLYDLMSDLSLSVWVQTTNSSRTEALISKYAAGGQGSGYLLRTTPAGVVELQFGGANCVSPNSLYTDKTKINDGNWHHVAVVIKLGISVNFYIDGALSSSFSVVSVAGPAASILQFGLNPFTFIGTYFTGAMDDVRIYNRALSSSEITSLFLNQVAAPTFSPGTGTYNAPQQVTISTTTFGASVRYTTDGSTPTSTSGVLYNGPVTINTTATVNAIAYATGMTDSAVSSAVYTLPVAAPAFSIAGGTYNTPQSVSLSSATSGASIRYTTDGSNPSETVGNLYAGPFTVSATETINAIAYAAGRTDSSISSATYTLMAAPPTFNPPAGTYGSAQQVTISTITPGTTIRYTTDGSNPTESSGTLYSGPVNVGSTLTLRAIAYANGFTDSAINSSAYTITVPVAAPSFSTPGGSYSGTQQVSITTTTQGASIRYTTDGTNPTALSGVLYSGPITVNASATLTAIAYASGMIDSPISSATYTISAINTGNSVQFLRADTTTRGNWQSVYGADGFNVIGDSVKNPTYATITPAGQSSWTWASSTTDTRGLQKFSTPSDRIASTWYSATNFSFDVNPTDGNSHQIALYFVDWDNQNRSERIDVLDAQNGNVLDTRSISSFSGTPQYLVWNLTGRVIFKVTSIGGLNAVLNGIFFGGAGSSGMSSVAQFVKIDTTTRGNWQGSYGADGFNVINDTVQYPSYAVVTPTGQSTWTWAASTTDARGLQKFSISGDRIAATWYSASNFSVDVNFIDGITHQLALYCVDWDNLGRSERIDVLDAQTNAVLDTRTISSFSSTPQYVVWNITGHVVFKITSTGSSNAILNGLFFGAGGSGGGTTSTAQFLNSDTTTKGSWQGVYGADGFNVISDIVQYPSYATVIPSGQLAYAWASSTSDIRGLQKPSVPGDRLATTWYSATNFTVDVNLTDGITHQVALYFVDWDNQGRKERIDILDAQTGTVLDTRTISSFSSTPQYLVWNLKGHLVLKVTSTGALNAVLSGVFFGGGASGGGATSTAQFLNSDTSTKGNWQGVYGADGFNIISDTVNDPPYANVTANGQLTYTWASSTSDTRGLRKFSNPSDRIAATWYSSTTFNVDVNLTDGNAHPVALYFVDWDNQGRSERIDVLDALTGIVLDTRTVSSFSSTPQYLVWNLKGHLVLKITSTGPLNAVLSGLFFGGGGSGTTNTALFVKTDTSTLGNWQGVYGADGFNVINDTSHYPSYASVTPAGQLSWTWTSSTNDTRALQKSSNPSDRIAATWYSGTTFSVDVNLTDGSSHQVALYFLDWDNQSRSERIDVLDAQTGIVLDTRTVSSFSTIPQYLVWNLKGHVILKFTSIGGLNAVLNGLFFQ